MHNVEGSSREDDKESVTPLDPYNEYTETNLANANPTSLVVALYEGAIAAVRIAERCLASGEIMARGKAITKAVNILTELLVSLNHKQGGATSRNLQQLYLYAQKRLLEAHTRQTHEPLGEVDRLLSTLLEGWQKIAEEQTETEKQLVRHHPAEINDAGPEDAPYAFYFCEPVTAAPTISLAC